MKWHLCHVAKYPIVFFNYSNVIIHQQEAYYAKNTFDKFFVEVKLGPLTDRIIGKKVFINDKYQG